MYNALEEAFTIFHPFSSLAPFATSIGDEAMKHFSNVLSTNSLELALDGIPASPFSILKDLTTDIVLYKGDILEWD
jgi:hypothetical protein